MILYGSLAFISEWILRVELLFEARGAGKPNVFSSRLNNVNNRTILEMWCIRVFFRQVNCAEQVGFVEDLPLAWRETFARYKVPKSVQVLLTWQCGFEGIHGLTLVCMCFRTQPADSSFIFKTRYCWDGEGENVPTFFTALEASETRVRRNGICYDEAEIS